jgi:hypothetical protein
MDFISYIFSGGIFKTLKRLNKDECWLRAKNKTYIILRKSLLFYTPFIILATVSLLKGYGWLTCLILMFLFCSIPLYCKKILFPLIDKWYRKD